MTTKRRFLSGCGLLAALAAAVLPVQALAGAQAPFTGSDKGHFTIAQNTCGPKSSWHRVSISGTGTSKQFGQYSYRANECFDGSLYYHGSFTIKAGNGTVVGTYSGTVGPTNDPNVASYDQNATVLGGTGCFSGPSGKFHVSGLANLKTGDYSQKLSGVLSGLGAAGK